MNRSDRGGVHEFLWALCLIIGVIDFVTGGVVCYVAGSLCLAWAFFLLFTDRIVSHHG